MAVEIQVLESFDYGAIRTRLEQIQSGRDGVPGGRDGVDDVLEKLSKRQRERRRARGSDEQGEQRDGVFSLSFGSGRNVMETHAAVLDRAATVIAERACRVEVHGYSDYRGTYGRSVQLAAEQAITVTHALMDYGVDAHRIETISHGRTATKSGNTAFPERRVEIVLVS